MPPSWILENNNAWRIEKRRAIKKRNVWTSVISKAFWREYPMPCAFSFRRADVNHSTNGTYFIKINGYCRGSIAKKKGISSSSGCTNTFVGIMRENPGDGDAVIHVETRDTRTIDCHPQVSRYLKGEERTAMGKNLGTKSCAAVRRKIAKEEMTLGGSIPPHLYSQSVLRRVKKEAVDKEFGVSSDRRDIIRLIEDMMVEPDYIGAIDSVGSKPFHVFYGAPDQIHTYKEYCRIHKNSKIAIDATGSVVKRFTGPGGVKSGHIFLYAITINFNKTTIPVYQMLSEKHETEFIEYWLKQWLRRKVPLPAEAVCDYSRALLMALSLAFNNMTIKAYVDRCFWWATQNGVEKTKSDLAGTIIRIDVAHFVHAVTNWECFKKNKNKPYLKYFFVRCVTLMVDSNTVEKFEELFLLTCIVALQKHCDSTINISQLPLTHTTVEARRILENYISDRDLVINVDQFANDSPKLTTEENNNDTPQHSIGPKYQSKTESWIQKLRNYAQDNIEEGQQGNDLYFPEFINSLIRYAKEFPLWTNIMKPNDPEHATSSYIESYFNDWKNRTSVEIPKSPSVDLFLRAHLSDAIGGSRLFNADLQHAIKQSNVEATCKRKLKLISKSPTEASSRKRWKNTFHNIEDNDKMINNSITNSLSPNISLIVDENNLQSPPKQLNLHDSDLVTVEDWRGLATKNELSLSDGFEAEENSFDNTTSLLNDSFLSEHSYSRRPEEIHVQSSTIKKNDSLFFKDCRDPSRTAVTFWLTKS